jgi:hypothetical protein
LWDEGQHLTSGYLGSRTTSQFMVVRAAKTQRGLQVVESPAAAEAPKVRNQLGVRILWLALRDSQGKLYTAQEVADGKQLVLQAADPGTAGKEVAALFNDVRPSFPEGYNPKYYRNAFGFRQRYYYPRYSDTDRNLPPPHFTQGILDRRLRAGTSGGVANLAAGSYLAVTEQGVEVPLAFDSLREEASFHLVYGTW